MKKLLFLLLVALATPAVAQEYTVEDGAVKFTRIYEDTGLDVQECHDRVYYHLAQVFNDSNNTCKMDTADKLLYKGLFTDVTVINMGLGAYWDFDVPFNLTISIKDNRMRVEVSVRAVEGSQSYDLVDAYPLNEDHEYFEVGVNKKQAERIFNDTINSVVSFIDGIGECLTTSTDEDW